MLTIYPEFIAPLFDKYTPLPDSELKRKIEALAATLSFPLKKLYVVEGTLCGERFPTVESRAPFIRYE